MNFYELTKFTKLPHLRTLSCFLQSGIKRNTTEKKVEWRSALLKEITEWRWYRTSPDPADPSRIYIALSLSRRRRRRRRTSRFR